MAPHFWPSKDNLCTRDQSPSTLPSQAAHLQLLLRLGELRGRGRERQKGKVERGRGRERARGQRREREREREREGGGGGERKGERGEEEVMFQCGVCFEGSIIHDVHIIHSTVVHLCCIPCVCVCVHNAH